MSFVEEHVWGNVFAAIAYIVTSLLFTIIDLFQLKPRLNNAKYPTISMEIKVASNPLCIYIVASLIQLYLIDFASIDDILNNYESMSLLIYILEILFLLICADFFTFIEHYYQHKIKYWRINIHYQHHIYDDCLISWCAAEVHPIEQIIFWLSMNITPISSYLLNIYHFNPMSLWIYLVIYVSLIVEQHSGYDLILSPHNWMPYQLCGGACFHQYHHIKNNINYGFVFTFWDTLFGTYSKNIDCYH